LTSINNLWALKNVHTSNTAEHTIILDDQITFYEIPTLVFIFLSV